MSVDREFLERLSSIGHHGLGLSVDVYQPALLELMESLRERDLTCEYLEIFRAADSALTNVRQRLPDMPLEYHAEGLWLTQPDLLTRYPIEDEINTAVEHLRILGSRWANYEGASKQMAGYSFGTYLPPLFTRPGAEITAENAVAIQHRFDQYWIGADRPSPLLLIETPPLTYFAFGDLDMPSFFAHLTRMAPCGLVLDVGHVWTVYRYSGEACRRSLWEFLGDFLDRFPLERVVHLHVAGLAPFQACIGTEQAALPAGHLPWWIDAHGAPIPDILFEMLDLILSHPRLTHAKGLALEVDTKAIEDIVEEFERFRARFRWWPRQGHPQPEAAVSSFSHEPSTEHSLSAQQRAALVHDYEAYAKIASGKIEEMAPALPSRGLETGALERYRNEYLPNEILCWGGNVADLFPRTCGSLGEAGISLDQFIAYWFATPRHVVHPYDFFLLKLDLFVAFVGEVLPQATQSAREEADTLRAGYREACEQVTNEA